MATKRWFTALSFMRQRSGDYRKIGPRALADLASFCRANETCFHEDARKHAVLEGRREVWLRIQQHLNLTGEELMAIYAGRDLNLERNMEDDNA